MEDLDGALLHEIFRDAGRDISEEACQAAIQSVDRATGHGPRDDSWPLPLPGDSRLTDQLLSLAHKYGYTIEDLQAG